MCQGGMRSACFSWATGRLGVLGVCSNVGGIIPIGLTLFVILTRIGSHRLPDQSRTDRLACASPGCWNCRESSHAPRAFPRQGRVVHSLCVNCRLLAIAGVISLYHSKSPYSGFPGIRCRLYRGRHFALLQIRRVKGDSA